MGLQILNRREPIYAEEIPAEIVDSSGFLKATNYATSTTGGTVKVDGTYQIELTSGGKLKAKEVSAEDYPAANDASFISKGTLDNVLAALPSGGGAIDTLWEEDEENPTACTAGAGVTLTHNSVDYKFLVVVLRRSDKSLYIPSLFITSVQNAAIAPAGVNNNGNAVPVVATLNGTAITLPNDTGMGSLYWHKVYGIK